MKEIPYSYKGNDFIIKVEKDNRGLLYNLMFADTIYRAECIKRNVKTQPAYSLFQCKKDCEDLVELDIDYSKVGKKQQLADAQDEYNEAEAIRLEAKKNYDNTMKRYSKAAYKLHEISIDTSELS